MESKVQIPQNSETNPYASKKPSQSSFYSWGSASNGCLLQADLQSTEDDQTAPRKTTISLLQPNYSHAWLISAGPKHALAVLVRDSKSDTQSPKEILVAWG